MKAATIRQMRSDFWEEKQHAIANPVSLIAPSEDKTVLFNVAGMQPLVPYLSGKKHPQGSRLYNIQKCIRTNDIEEIGDERHLSMFEMMGNRSLGDYFKKESLTWSREFLTNQKYLGLDPQKLGCSVFGGYIKNGETIIPYDQEAHDILIELGMNPNQIKSIAMDQGKKCDNFRGPAGSVGPCGPSAEFHYDRGDTYGPNDWNIGENDRFIEIRNNVFMEFYKDEKGEFTPLSQQNVDTGMGFERLAMVKQSTETIFETDIFSKQIKLIETFSETIYPAYQEKAPKTDEEEAIIRSYRIICDHIRASIFLLSDGITPSNEGRGYVLRRLIRRAGFHLYKLQEQHDEHKLHNFLHQCTNTIMEQFDGAYEGMSKQDEEKKEEIAHRLLQEIDKFLHTISKGEKQLEKFIQNNSDQKISGKIIFMLYDTFGFPVELTQEIAETKRLGLDMKGFEQEMKSAQEKARSDSKNKFSRGVDRAKYLEGIPATKFTGYTKLIEENPVIIKQFQLDDGQDIIIFSSTPFYASSGGQTADHGHMELEDGIIYHIHDVVNYEGVYLHFVQAQK